MDATLVAATRLSPQYRNGLITLQVHCPEGIHAQLLRHRRASPNWISHRVGNVDQHLAYYVPELWYGKGKGMLSGEALPRWKQGIATLIARATNAMNRTSVRALSALGVCPSQAGRYNNHTHYMTGIITATEQAWRALLELRLAADADPAMQILARHIRDAIRHVEWHYSSFHLPYYQPDADAELGIDEAMMVCAARIARISYGGAGRKNGDLRLGERLIRDKHWSPFDQLGLWRLGRDLNISPLCTLPEDTVLVESFPNPVRGGWLSGRLYFEAGSYFRIGNSALDVLVEAALPTGNALSA
jgi:hypothetical protein